MIFCQMINGWSSQQYTELQGSCKGVQAQLLSAKTFDPLKLTSLFSQSTMYRIVHFRHCEEIHSHIFYLTVTDWISYSTYNEIQSKTVWQSKR